MSKRSYSYHVRPRYTPGSPALVSEKTAMQVADDEKKCYERLIDPSYAGMVPSDEAKARAEGLGGIVEAKREHGGGWDVLDVLTGRRFWRGEKKCYNLLAGDRITRIESYSVNYISWHEPEIKLPRTVKSIQIRGAHAIVFLDTPVSVSSTPGSFTVEENFDRLTCAKSSLFVIERDEKAP
jgi:hypothetical protein